MMNPIVIIITISLILSVLVICVINKPKKPIITGTVIFILICYVAITFLIDSAITGMGNNDSFNGLVHFLVMNESPSYDDLADSFQAFMKMDISLIVTALISLFMEIMVILRKDSKK